MADRQGRSGLRAVRRVMDRSRSGLLATLRPHRCLRDERTSGGRPGTFVPASDGPHDRPTRGSRRQLDVTCLPCRVGPGTGERCPQSAVRRGGWRHPLLDRPQHYTRHDRSGPRRPSGGTSPILLRVAPDGRDLIGLAPGEAQCRGAIVDLRGRSSARSTLPLEERNSDAAVELVAQLVDAIRARPVPGVLGAAASDDTTDRAETRRTDQRSDLRQPCLTSLGASAPVDRRSTSRRGRRNGACGSHRSARGHGLPEVSGCKSGRRGVPFGSSLWPGIRQPRRELSMTARPQCGVEVRERLVEEHDIWSGASAGERDPSLHAAGQLMGHQHGRVGEVVDQRRSSAARTSRSGSRREPVAHVVGDGEVREEREVLDTIMIEL